MAEQQKTFADQVKQMGAIRENMNKLPSLVNKIKTMLPETLNYWGMVEALLNKLSAELTAGHAALKEVHAQAQVTGRVIHDVKDNVAIVKGAMNTAQRGTAGVPPVTAQPAAAPQVPFQEPKPQQVSLDQTIPVQPKTSAPTPDVGALLAQIASFQQAVQAMQAKQHESYFYSNCKPFSSQPACWSHVARCCNATLWPPSALPRGKLVLKWPEFIGARNSEFALNSFQSR